jgi:hydroxyacylglutathione hydrolase
LGEDNITLIDSGLPGTWENIILPYLRGLNRSPDEVTLVLHTHRDPDHVGGDRAIKAATNVKLAIHTLGARDLSSPDEARARYLARFGRYLTMKDLDNLQERPLDQPLKMDRHLEDGDSVDAGPLRLEVIHTPGHTPDSVCYYDRARGTLFTGDSIQGGATRCDDLTVIQDADAYDSAVDKLTRLDIALLLTAHPYLPSEEAALKGPEAQCFITYSGAFNAKIREQILQCLRERGSISAEEITHAVCPVLRRQVTEGVTHRTVIAHLLSLLGRGRVANQEVGSRILWRITMD